jgi:vancomycin resistance protein YoaR
MTASPDPALPAPHRTSVAMRFAIAFLLGVVLVIGLGAGALYAWGQQYQGRVLPGVHVGGTDLSGLTPDEAQAAIGQEYASLGNGRIVLTGPDGDTSIDYTTIDRGPDTAAILDAALAAGRQGAPLADLIGAPQAALRGVDLPAAVRYDKAKLAAAIDALAASIDQAPVDATVTTAKDGSFLPVAATPGRAVDKAALLATLDAQLSSLGTPTEIHAQVPVSTVEPAVPTEAANAAKAAADRMAVDLVFSRGSESWTIPGSRIRSLITFPVAAGGTIAPVVDEAGLDPLVAGLAKQINQAARSASIRLSGSKVVVSAPGREGRTLDVAATQAAVLAVLAARQEGSQEPALTPAVTVVQPKLPTALATSSAPKMKVVGQWTTWFPIWIGNGYGANIWVPAKLLNGYVVPPGGTFDFWKVIGTPSAAQGFTQGNAIINGRTSITGAFAGGICSTSTTLFNAALRAGYKMGARQNHYYFINRYPTGLDATVWISDGAKQTMSFTNDTPYPLLIQGINTRSGGRGFVTFKIWSVPNGRKVVIGAATIKNYQRAGDSEVKTASLPKGTSNRVQDPENGFDAWRTVTVLENGKVLRKTTYYSHYATVTGVVEVGTGG